MKFLKEEPTEFSIIKKTKAYLGWLNIFFFLVSWCYLLLESLLLSQLFPACLEQLPTPWLIRKMWLRKRTESEMIIHILLIQNVLLYQSKVGEYVIFLYFKLSDYCSFLIIWNFSVQLLFWISRIFFLKSILLFFFIVRKWLTLIAKRIF